jgi:PII-like signaling protein
MKGCSLRFYMHENQTCRGMPMYEWLLEQARGRGIHGGSAFRTIAGYGRHGILREQHFFELAGSVTVLVEFLVSDEEADALLVLAGKSEAPMFHARIAAEFGAISPATGA